MSAVSLAVAIISGILAIVAIVLILSLRSSGPDGASGPAGPTGSIGPTGGSTGPTGPPGIGGIQNLIQLINLQDSNVTVIPGITGINNIDYYFYGGPPSDTMNIFLDVNIIIGTTFSLNNISQYSIILLANQISNLPSPLNPGSGVTVTILNCNTGNAGEIYDISLPCNSSNNALNKFPATSKNIKSSYHTIQ